MLMASAATGTGRTGVGIGSVLENSGWMPGSKVGKGDGTTSTTGEGEDVGIGLDVGEGVAVGRDAPVGSGVELGTIVGREELTSAGGEGLTKGATWVSGAEGELRDG